MRNIHDWFSTADDRTVIQHDPAALNYGDIFIGPGGNDIYEYVNDNNGGGEFIKLIHDQRRSGRVATSAISSIDNGDSSDSNGGDQ